MIKTKDKKGITLIALVITIIILIILAGVAISLTLGQNGIFLKAKNAKVEYEKASLKEELEIEIANIKIKKNEEGKELKREDLIELSNIGAVMESYGIPAQGNYKDYLFHVNENYEVTIKNKIEGEVPTITAQIIADGSKTTAEIQVTASINEGTIESIEATNGAILKESVENTNTKKTFVVSEIGTYYFMAISSNGRSAVTKVEVNSLQQKLFLFKEGTGKENWEYKTVRGTEFKDKDNYIYMKGASIYGDANAGYGILYLKEMIDLTPYSKLCVELEAKSTQPSSNAGELGVTKDPTNEWRTGKTGTYDIIYTTDRDICKYDIPEEYDIYSPCIRVTNGISGTYSEVVIYNVWLEE